jgi:hypothetical protein
MSATVTARDSSSLHISDIKFEKKVEAVCLASFSASALAVSTLSLVHGFPPQAPLMKMGELLLWVEPNKIKLVNNEDLVVVYHDKTVMEVCPVRRSCLVLHIFFCP